MVRGLYILQRKASLPWNCPVTISLRKCRDDTHDCVPRVLKVRFFSHFWFDTAHQAQRSIQESRIAWTQQAGIQLHRIYETSHGSGGTEHSNWKAIISVKVIAVVLYN